MTLGQYILHKDNGTTYDEKSILAESGKILGFDSSLNPVMTTALSNLGYTPENVANKENVFLDYSTVKYPTNNLLKTSIETNAYDADMFGFLNQAETTISFDETTKVFTLGSVGATWSYYRSGIKYTITGSKTINLTTLDPVLVDGAKYYITIDSATGDLLVSKTVWTLQDTALPVVIITWNNTLTPKYLLQEERHSCKYPRRLHLYLHNTRGTQYVTGGQLTGFTALTTTNAANTFAIGQSVIADEDLYETLPLKADGDGADPTNYLMTYRNGTGTWIWSYSDMPFSYTTDGYINWDNGGTLTQGTGGAGAAVRYYNTYLVFTNTQGDGRFVIVVGQNQYTTTTDAHAEAFENFDLIGFPKVEWVAMYQMTWMTGTAGLTNKGKVSLTRAPKRITISAVTSSSTSTVSHNALAGLQGGLATTEYYHLNALQHIIATQPATGAMDGYLLSTDWTTFNSKQDALGGTGIVKSTTGTISYLADNSTNWNTAYGWGNHSGLYAPISGSANYIQNQIAVAQAASSWINGKSIVGNSLATFASGHTVLFLNEKTTDVTQNVFTQQAILDVAITADSSKVFNAAYYNVSVTGTGNITGRVTGFQGQINHQSGSSITQIRGVSGIISNESTGIITNAYAGRFYIQNTGAGTIANAYNMYILSTVKSAGIITNNYGLYIENQFTGTNNWAIYSAGGDSYFAGAIVSASFQVEGGTVSQFLKANGTVDSTSYQPAGTYSTDIHSNITALNAVSGTNTGDNAINTRYEGSVGIPYPGAGIAVSTGTAWATSITDNSANWNTAYSWGNHAGLYSLLGHNHSGVYEPVFSKNTGFNLALGTTAGTVAEGNDSRIINGATAYSWGNHAGLYLPVGGIAIDSDKLDGQHGSYYQPASTAITTSNIGSQSVSFATSASLLKHYPSRTDSAWYNIVWASGDPTYAYSCDAIQIQSSTGTVKATKIAVNTSSNSENLSVVGNIAFGNTEGKCRMIYNSTDNSIDFIIN